MSLSPPTEASLRGTASLPGLSRKHRPPSPRLGSKPQPTPAPLTCPQHPPVLTEPLRTKGFELHEAERPLQPLHWKRSLMNKYCTRVVFSCPSTSAKHWTRDLEASAITCNLNKLPSEEQGREKGCSHTSSTAGTAEPQAPPGCSQGSTEGRQGEEGRERKIFTERPGKQRGGQQ